MTKLMWIALAGAFGTLGRYGVSLFVRGWTGDGFPWGTLAVNAVGCFLFGVVLSAASQRIPLSPETKTVLMVGFLGAFTTFSTYLAELVPMIEAQRYGLAVANFLAQNLLGVGLFVVGSLLGRQL